MSQEIGAILEVDDSPRTDAQDLLNSLSPDFRAGVLKAYPDLMKIEDPEVRAQAALNAVNTILCPIRDEIHITINPHDLNSMQIKQVIF
jgi:hypothetical protein